MSQDSCGTCKFAIIRSRVDAPEHQVEKMLCLRFPESIIKYRSDRCGEFKVKEQR